MLAFPRLYIIHDGKVAMKGGEGPLNYKLEDAARWIRNYLQEGGCCGTKCLEMTDVSQNLPSGIVLMQIWQRLFTVHTHLRNKLRILYQLVSVSVPVANPCRSMA